jgi:hypothetical protein
VCEKYAKIHLCGDGCTERELTARSEGYVCRLTGMCVGGAVLSLEIPFSRDPKHARCTPIRMDTTGAPRKTKQPTADEVAAKIHAKISGRVTSVFVSAEREQIYKEQLDRFNAEVEREVRSIPKPIDVVDMNQKIRRIMDEFGAALNPPPIEFRSALKAAITADFVAYFHAVCNQSKYDAEPLEKTGVHADQFTACICTWLARGYPITTHSIVAPHPFFTHHIPPTIHFNNFTGISCSNMSTFARKFKQACYGLGECARPGTRFKFSVVTINELDRTMQHIERRLELDMQ